MHVVVLSWLIKIAQLSILLANPRLDPGLTTFTMELAAEAANVMYSGDIQVLIDLLDRSLSGGSALSLRAIEVRRC